MSQHMRQQPALGWGANVAPGSYLYCSPDVPFNLAARALPAAPRGGVANPTASATAALTGKEATVCLPHQPPSAGTSPLLERLSVAVGCASLPSRRTFLSFVLAAVLGPCASAAPVSCLLGCVVWL
jgi:hypothetical protein